MTEQNKQTAKTLLALAAVYDASEKDIKPLMPYIHVDSKGQMVDAIRAIGGKFIKRMSDYSYMMESQRIPGVTIMANRDSICRKIVTFDCTPLFSEEESAEIEVEAQAS